MRLLETSAQNPPPSPAASGFAGATPALTLEQTCPPPAPVPLLCVPPEGGLFSMTVCGGFLPPKPTPWQEVALRGGAAAQEPALRWPRGRGEAGGVGSGRGVPPSGPRALVHP